MVATTNERGLERCVRHNAHVSAWKVFLARQVAKDVADLAASMGGIPRSCELIGLALRRYGQKQRG